MSEQPVKKKNKIISLLFPLIVVLAVSGGLVIFLRVDDPKPLEIGLFSGDVKVFKKKNGDWMEPVKEGLLVAGDKVQTESQSYIGMHIKDKFYSRLKENSLIELSKPSFFSTKPVHRIHFHGGTLFGVVERDTQDYRFEILAPNLIVPQPGTTFEITKDPDSGRVWIGVLKGTVEVLSDDLIKRRIASVKGLEKAEIQKSEVIMEPERVSREDWNSMREAYELTHPTFDFEAIQRDLSKGAGTMFRFVFDHGTFFTPRVGYAKREFIKNHATQAVYLIMEYDVFPTGSFVGMYMKTRGFDISKYKMMSFEARRVPDEYFPENFLIEFKKSGGIVRTYRPGQFKKRWQQYVFPLRFTKETMVDEITFVFSNDRVGEHKKGSLQLRNFELVPLTEPAQIPTPTGP